MSEHLEPELLANGDILAPITEADGTQKLIRLEAGEEEHAAWLGYIQRHRAAGAPPPPPDLFYDPPQPPPVPRRIPWLSLLLGLAGVLAVVWYTGALDGPLSSIGLNKNPCIVTALGGSKLCGKDAEAWCDSTDRLRRFAPGASRDTQSTCDEIRHR